MGAHNVVLEELKSGFNQEVANEKSSSTAVDFIKAKAYGLISIWVLDIDRETDDIRSHLENNEAAKLFVSKYNLYFDAVTYFNRYHIIASLAKGINLAELDDLATFVDSL